MKTVYVIKALQKGVWYYYRSSDKRATKWDADLYAATKFESYPDAEKFLSDACEKLYWGGYFEINKYFVNS